MDPLILLRRLGGPVFTLNPDLIERAEATPDTVVTLIGGNKYVICESLDELVELIRDFRASIIASAEAMTGSQYSDAGTAHATGHPRMRVLSTAGSPGGQPPVVPIRRNDS